MILQLFLLMYLLGVTVTQSFMESPCPEVFCYEQQTEPDKWYGVISIQSPEELVGISIDIKLDNNAELLGNWFGETYSFDNQEFYIVNPDYILRAGSRIRIRFFIKFNSPLGLIPKLENIRLNGKIICLKTENVKKNELNLRMDIPVDHDSQPVNSETKYDRKNGTRPVHLGVIGLINIDGSSFTPNENTSNILDSSISSNDLSYKYQGHNTTSEGELLGRKKVKDEHFDSIDVAPISFNDSITSNSEEDFFHGDFNEEFQHDKNVGDDHQEKYKDLECGTVALRPRPFITYGQDTAAGDWPWHAALYHPRGIQIIYICGGTVVSEMFVLTAAHCVARSRTNKPVDQDDILVYLGKHSLKTFGPESQSRDVSEIFLHPEFNYSTYFNDIALLKISKPIEITDYVRPVCLWGDSSDLRSVVGQEGTVVGWGFDEKKIITDKLMQAKMPVVTTNQCIESNRNFFGRYTFPNNYCAGFRNGTSVCNGDSGGSMVFPRKGTSGKNTVWQIRGIVSVGVALQSDGACDASQYIIFTDVAKYVNWIRRVVNDNL